MTPVPRCFPHLLVGCAVLLGLGREAHAQTTYADRSGALTFSVKIEAEGAKAAVHRGRTFRVLVSGRVKEGNHVYSFTKVPDGTDPSFSSRIRFKLPPGVEVLWPGKEKEPVLKAMPEVSYYEHEGEFFYSQDLLVLPEAQEGNQPLELHFNMQVCDEQTCRPVRTALTLTVPISNKLAEAVSPELEKRRAMPMPEVQQRAGWSVELLAAKPAAPQSGKIEPKKEQTAALPDSEGIAVSREEYAAFMVDALPGLLNIPESKKLITQANSGLLLFILWGMAWGAISLVTPCVFPMIPITVSFFLKQAEKEHHRPVRTALVYSLTIIVVLTLAAALFINFFRWLSVHPLTNFAIGGLLVYFALSLLGMFEITLPHGLAQFTSAREGRGGTAGTVFMALTFTIVSFACVAPFLGGFAGAAASNRPWWHTILGGLAFSTTFAAPFFLLALFPAMIRKLPHSGTWLNTIKVVMGFLELAAALKFLRTGELLSSSSATFFTFDLVLGMYVALALLCGAYLLSMYRLPHDSPLEHLSVPRVLLAAAFIALGCYLLPGLFKYGPEGEQQRPQGTVYSWVESFLLPDARSVGKTADLQHAIAQAREQRRATGKAKRIFLEVTGISCNNCRLNENGVFRLPAIKKLFEPYTFVLLFTDRVPNDLYTADLQASFGSSLSRQLDDAEANADCLKRTFGTIELPFYVILEPRADSERIDVLGTYGGVIHNPQSFADFLRRPKGQTLLTAMRK